jgi:hypothetical protein
MPRPADLGEGTTEAVREQPGSCGSIYPIKEEAPHGMEWWNGLPETRRAH